MVSSNVDVYNFTYNNPVYNVYVDVYDNYGMQEVGHIVHIQAFGKWKDLSTKTNI